MPNLMSLAFTIAEISVFKHTDCVKELTICRRAQNSLKRYSIIFCYLTEIFQKILTFFGGSILKQNPNNKANCALIQEIEDVLTNRRSDKVFSPSLKNFLCTFAASFFIIFF